MSDINDSYYNAWLSVMNSVPHKLYCSWHVDRAWKTNLMKIVSSNQENSIKKRKDVYKTLKVLQTSLVVNEFHSRLEEFLRQLENDPDTKIFYEYFWSKYGHNFLSWAYCFRKELLINTNMYLESMHRIIKYEYLEGKKIKRLDKSLHNLMKYTRDKQVERLCKITKGKNTDRINRINKSHRAAVNSGMTAQSIEGAHDYKRWSVSNSDNGSTYMVTEKTSNICCALACNICHICYHSCSCTCVDYYLKSNICTHIHFIYITKLENFSPTYAPCTISHLSQEEIKSSLKNLSNEPREKYKLQQSLQDHALELVGLCNQTYSSEILSTAIKQVKSTISLLKANNTVDQFIKKDIGKFEPGNKKINKQVSFFSTRQKRKKQPKPLKVQQQLKNQRWN